MNDLHKNIGKRLRYIREIFNEGSKLSADQFAFILDETGDKIRNYELGRAKVRVRLLHTLYYKGINPTYIITGEGEVFADNQEGRALKSKIRKNKIKGKISNENGIIKAVAGKIDD